MALANDLRVFADQLEALVVKDPKWKTERASRKVMYTHLLTQSASPQTFVPVLHRESVISHLLNKWYDYDVLQSAIDDELTTDITAIGDVMTIIRRDGVNRESTEATFASEKDLENFIDRQLDGTPYTYSLADPITDAITADGYRMNIIGGPSTRMTVRDDLGQITTKSVTIISIRKPLYPFSLDDFVKLKTMNQEMRTYCLVMQQLGDSFLVAGGTGSAKSSFMNGLTGDIPDGYKNLFIEELPEMTPLCTWALRLTDRNSNQEGKGVITMMRNLINSFRMDCENVYIGEVRTAVIARLFLRVALALKRQTGTTFHIQIGFKDPIPNVLDRFILEATEGGGPSAREVNTASMMANRIRQIITMKDEVVSGQSFKRVTAMGEIVGFDMQKRALLWVPVCEYDFRRHDWTFHGVSPQFAERAEIEGVECALPVTDGVREFFIP